MSQLVFDKENPQAFVAELKDFLNSKKSNLLVFDNRSLFNDFSNFLLHLDSTGELPKDVREQVEKMFQRRSEKKLLLRTNGAPTSFFILFEAKDIFACSVG